MQFGRSPCGCFDGETEVLTEGGYKAIKDVEQYEKVLAKNELTGELAYKAVTELLRYDNRKFYQLELVAEDGAISQYTVTDDHPFWVKGIGWVESDELQQGMPVVDLQNEIHTVHYFSPIGKIGKAYNFEVADFHTYFVGEENIWVHNCPKSLDTSSDTARQALRKAKEANGIPKSAQPDRTIKPNTLEGDKLGLDNRNVKLYEYTNSNGQKVHIRQDKAATYNQGGVGNQTPHFNAGPAGSKLKQHHYY